MLVVIFHIPEVLNSIQILLRRDKHGDIHRRDLGREAAQVKPDFKERI